MPFPTRITLLTLYHYKDNYYLKMATSKGAWVAQSVKCPTLDFGSGHNLMVHEIQPCVSSALIAWSLLGILSLPFYLPFPLSRSLSPCLSLSQNK